MAEVQLVDIEKRYGSFLAVPKQSLTIEHGEFLVLLGPSGCGKTTTMRMIAGLEDITAGDILIDGARVNDKPPKDRDIAMVFQNYGLYPHMTVAQNIAYPLKLRGVERADPKAHDRADRAHQRRLQPVRQLIEHGFTVVATGGTQTYLAEMGLPVERVNKVAEGRPHIVDRLHA